MVMNFEVRKIFLKEEIIDDIKIGIFILDNDIIEIVYPDQTTDTIPFAPNYVKNVKALVNSYKRKKENKCHL